MKKSKMPLVGAIIGGVGVIGLLGMLQAENKGAMLFGSLVLIAVGAVIVFLGIRKNNAIIADKPLEQKQQQHTETKTNIVKTANTSQDIQKPIAKPISSPITDILNNNSAPADGNKGAHWIPLEINGYYKIYEYLENVCFDKSEENPYEYVQEKANAKQRSLTFEFEEDNPHDENAIAIMLEDKKIGYVYQGMIYKMIHDYARKGYQVCANINTFSPEKITYYIGFYKPKDACKQYEVSIKNKKLSDNYSEGSILSVEYDVLEERFIITDDCGEKICDLPKRAEEYARENNSIPIIVGENSESIIFLK